MVAILGLIACSTEPEIDWDKLEEQSVLVTCELMTGPSGDGFGNLYHRQRVLIQDLRPLVGYAFAANDDRYFGVPGATVSVTDSLETYEFVDQNNGLYIWEGDSTWVAGGMKYDLNITLEDGRFIHGEKRLPDFDFKDMSDTVWIQPDSGVIIDHRFTPIINEASFGHTINYTFIPVDGWLLTDPHTRNYYNSAGGDSVNLWYNYSATGSTITVQTASTSPTRFMNEYDVNNPIVIQFYFSAKDSDADDMENLLWDDVWPIENLNEVSNLEGGYGIFTSNSLYYAREYILAIKK